MVTRKARIDEINRELNTMDDTLSGCDWCPECGGGLTVYNKLLDELRELEGAYLRVTCWSGEIHCSIKYDYRPENERSEGLRLRLSQVERERKDTR